MEKEIRTSLWVEDGAIRIDAEFEDFDGDLAKWKESFYQVWRYQMTWSFAYSIKLIDRRATGVCLYMLIKKAYLKQTREMLEYLGYKKFTEQNENVGFVPTWDIKDPIVESMYEIYVD